MKSFRKKSLHGQSTSIQKLPNIYNFKVIIDLILKLKPVSIN